MARDKTRNHQDAIDLLTLPTLLIGKWDEDHNSFSKVNPVRPAKARKKPRLKYYDNVLCIVKYSYLRFSARRNVLCLFLHQKLQLYENNTFAHLPLHHDGPWRASPDTAGQGFYEEPPSQQIEETGRRAPTVAGSRARTGGNYQDDQDA